MPEDRVVSHLSALAAESHRVLVRTDHDKLYGNLDFLNLGQRSMPFLLEDEAQALLLRKSHVVQVKYEYLGSRLMFTSRVVTSRGSLQPMLSMPSSILGAANRRLSQRYRVGPTWRLVGRGLSRSSTEQSIDILDVSASGVGLAVDPSEFPIDEGSFFNATLTDPSGHQIQVRLLVATLKQVPFLTGKLLAGCSFHGLGLANYVYLAAMLAGTTNRLPPGILQLV